MKPQTTLISTVFVALLLTVPCAAVAQDAPAKPAPGQPAPDNSSNPLHTATRQELDIVKVLVAQEKAWNKGDLDEYAKGYKDSPDTLFIGRQISKGYAQMLSDYHRNYPNIASMGMLEYQELEVHPLSETFAVVIGKYHLDRTKKEGGSADGIFSLVFEKTDDGWKIVVDHTT